MDEHIKEFTVPQKIADQIENYITTSGNISFKFNNNTLTSDEISLIYKTRNIKSDIKSFDNIEVKDSYFFGATVVDLKVMEPEHAHNLKQLQDYIVHDVIKHPVTIKYIRINCFTKMFCDDSITTVHPDYGISFDENLKSYSVIYYVNDSSGDTHFFDEDLKLKKRITPKKGNGVIFNSSILHAGQYPKSHLPRFAIYMLIHF